MTPGPTQPQPIIPPLTGVIDDIGPVQTDGRTIVAIMTLDSELNDNAFTPACGKRVRVLIEEAQGEPVAPEYDSVGGGTD